jgi:hypothetical protein
MVSQTLNFGEPHVLKWVLAPSFRKIKHFENKGGAKILYFEKKLVIQKMA